jgi:hypothetical protein
LTPPQGFLIGVLGNFCGRSRLRAPSAFQI